MNVNSILSVRAFCLLIALYVMLDVPQIRSGTSSRCLSVGGTVEKQIYISGVKRFTTEFVSILGCRRRYQTAANGACAEAKQALSSQCA